MPELPEVQTVVDDLKSLNIIGSSITDVQCFWPKTACGASKVYLKNSLVGKKFTNIDRRAKYIVFVFHDKTQAILHLRMSGHVRYVKLNKPREKHEHLLITLDNSFQIRFYDPRKFGRIYFGKYLKEQLDKLGPEPLHDDFTAEKFSQMIQAKNRRLKPLLLDQSFLAGLGNICVDEVLWMSKIHPNRVSSTLTKRQTIILHQNIQSFLKKAIANKGTSLGDGAQNFTPVNSHEGQNQHYLDVYGRKGEPCHRCKQPIIRVLVGQRGTHLCPRCQK